MKNLFIYVLLISVPVLLCAQEVEKEKANEEMQKAKQINEELLKEKQIEEKIQKKSDEMQETDKVKRVEKETAKKNKWI